MYGFNSLGNLPITGSLIQIIKFGKFQTWFDTSNHWSIQVMNKCEILKNETIISEYDNIKGWNNNLFQEIIEKEIIELKILNDDQMKIVLCEKYEIKLFDDDKHYESLMITGPENKWMVI